MRTRCTRMFAAVAAGAVAGVLGLTGAGAPQAAGAPRAAVARAVPGTQLWVSRYDGPGHDGDDASAVATSPDGQTVYVTGGSTGTGAFLVSQFATIAYQASTGTQLWVRRYDNPGGTQDQAVAVAVSPDGGLVFVTGLTSGAGIGAISTVAYGAATGAFQWATSYQTPHGEDVSSMAVSPDGKTVFITGIVYRAGSGSDSDYLTVAYRAATGAQLWVRRYRGQRSGFNAAASVAVSPGGKTVFVTGTSERAHKGGSNSDYATVAYRAATGARLWVRRYNGPGNRGDEAASVAVSPGGRTVLVTGESTGVRSREDYATVAYRAATGARAWVRRYNGPGNGGDSAAAVAVSPDGRTLFVTGSSKGVRSLDDWATVAYRAATGARVWVKRHDGPVSSEDEAVSLAVSPDGSKVAVTGDSWLDSPQNRTAPTEYVTIAYGAATGARLWARHYQNGRDDEAGAASVAVSRAGLVFVTGTSQRANGDGDGDYLTIAYRG